ncbi:penicillin-binding transpeptidase domain-containing protein [Actinoallomurus rhizosphaericola]|uniref:penicillin-binding transpeptidase domain-containing protein n=1 Tax=Actinoallomurus rhizosphaericola TaxID=2952536 RepID=UPI002092975B|nr:penicillin-binding transpeptidase domain-containing protein [Actinoallomurus rhizosphaericola]MCO5998830.1 penicillin-binding transpeptidase domain-containing protein [Actinoallomurus rhizosphaericola]
MGIRRLRSAAGLAAALLATTATAGCFAEPSPLPTIRNFLVSWQNGNYRNAAKETDGDRTAVAAVLSALPSQLDLASLRLALGRVRQTGEDATAQFAVSIDLGDGGQPWSYGSSMRLHRTNGKWKVVWSPSIIHPQLGQGQRLAIVTTTPTRQPIVDNKGKTLLKKVEVDVFGVTPGRLANAEQTLGQLAKITHLDKDRVLAHVRSAPPQKFLPLVTLQVPQQAGDAAQLRQVPGVELRSKPAYVAPAVADEIVGDLGPATAERLQQVGAPYQPGDTIGVSGLQVLEQRKLAGTPTVQVVAQDPSGADEKILNEVRGTQSQSVATTIDRRTQDAAEAALKAVPYPASLAAIDPYTGAVLAAADNTMARKNDAHQSDDPSQQGSTALNGHYPPGMTFSIVTTRALLQHDQKITSPPCKRGTQNIGGQEFTYSGRVGKTFSSNFAVSCTTAFAALYRNVAPQDLRVSAARFGLGAPWSLPVPAFSGSVPLAANDAERAAEMVGQGKIEVSPLSMALVAGAVASGTWRPPQLLKDSPQSIQPQPLSGSTDSITQLQSLMQTSVRSGAARQAKVPPRPVAGVTAMVPYGNGKVVSWFVGYRQDVAFAIAVEGKVSAASLAAAFLRAKH